MRIRALLFAALAIVPITGAQDWPFETDALRKPRIATGGTCLIRGARILTGTKGVIEKGDILVRNGKIEKIGPNLQAPAGVTVIDATGKVIVPGFVDAHSHRGSDGTNEGSESITGEVRIPDVLNPSALNVWQALASGHTSALILHGSANSVGGESVVIKYKHRRTPEEAMVPDAPRMIKFALGENVTRKSSTESTRFPKTRMGVEAVYRRGFTEAKKYMAAWDAYEAGRKAGQSPKPPRKDLRLETLSDILRKKIWVHCHSYRADEILMMVRLSQDFGFKLSAMQHALEAYKIAPELAKAGVGVSVFADHWSYKQEAYDAIPFNAILCHLAGANVSINTDGTGGTTALNIDAAKVMRYGGLTEEEALRMVTINSAKQLGIDHRTGSLEVGKDADIAIWDGHPFSVYSKCWMTLVEGEVYFQRRDAFGIDAISTIKTVLDKPTRKAEPQLPPKSDVYAIVGATVHPVSGPVISNGTIILRNGKIEAVGKDIAVPRGARVVNAKGLNAYPGLIDGLTNMGLTEISGINVMTDNNEFGAFQPDLDAVTTLYVESAHFGPAKYNGITNAFTAPTAGTVSGQGGLINTDGYTTEQFGLQRKAFLHVNFPGGGRRFNFEACEDTLDIMTFMGLAGIEVADKTLGEYGLTVEQIRAFYDFLGGAGLPQRPQNNAPQAPQITEQQLAEYFDKAVAYAQKRKSDPNAPLDLSLEAMIPFVSGQKPVLLRVRGPAQIRAAVAFAKKYRLKAVLGGASECWKEAKLLAESNIPVIINPAGESTLNAVSTDNPWEPYDTPYVMPHLLAKAGVKFCFQSGSGELSMMLPLRVGQHCAYGLKPDEALRAMTLSAAEIFGVADKIGSIQAGKVGNIILTDGDPFEPTSTIQYVFIEGQPRPLTSKHTQLRDKYLERLKK